MVVRASVGADGFQGISVWGISGGARDGAGSISAVKVVESKIAVSRRDKSVLDPIPVVTSDGHSAASRSDLN